MLVGICSQVSLVKKTGAKRHDVGATAGDHVSGASSNGWRVSGERSEAERVRCTRVLGGRGILPISEGVLILHDQPLAAPLHHDERPDLALVLSP